MRRVTRSSFVGFVAIVGVLTFAGSATAQPTAAPPKPRLVDTTECSPTTPDGYQLCSTDKGTLQLVQPPGSAAFYQLDLTFVRELRQKGKAPYRSDEQHAVLELTKKGPGNEFVRTGAVLVTPDVTCTFDDSSTLTGNALRRRLSNLACTPGTTAGPDASASASPGARAASPTLPTYDDYSAVDTAPNGVATPIRYGTVGKGSPDTGSCPTTATSDFQTKINNAAAGSVICVQPPQGQAQGDYSTATMTVNKAVTVRAKGVIKVKNIVITGSNATVDGFNVVGGTLGNPNYAIKFSGTGHKITNNLVRGRGIWYAIGCDQSAGCGTNVLISGNSITGVHNFGIYLWGGDRITVEKNNVFDLFQSKDVDDVDALRAWGTNHVVRNNYFHDINAKKSAGSPHSDCYQAYQAGSSPRRSSNILYENNYCVRVTGQCIIVQNDLRKSAELTDYTVRGNVCETYGWQSIEFDAVPNIIMDNDYVAGVQVTVLNFANPGASGLPLSTFKVRNTVLVQSVSGKRYIDGTPQPVPADANRTLVDPAIKTSYDGFISPTTASYPPSTTDFNKLYRDSVGKASPPVKNQGATPNSTGLTTDVDGAARVQGTAIDVGPFEIG